MDKSSNSPTKGSCKQSEPLQEKQSHRPTKPKAVKPLRVPSYCHHAASGQAYVKIQGKVIHIGVHGSEASRVGYASIVADVLANRPAVKLSPASQAQVSQEGRPAAMLVRDVCSQYVAYAESYYVKNGKPTSEFAIVRSACDRTSKLMGDLPANAFGPLALKRLRESLVSEQLARTTINGLVSRIRRAFRWAAGEELIPAEVPAALAMVTGLRAGRSKAKESAPVLPVDDRTIESTLPYLPEVVADMVRLQRLTGMRPGEVCGLRPCDLNRADANGINIEIWTYRPASHKTEHHGRSRTIFIGPRAQAVLLPYLVRHAQAYCFTPSDSERKRRALAHAMRTTPLSCGDRPGTNRAPQPKRTAGEGYSSCSYGRAVKRACKRAEVDAWSPNQLRHTAATEARAKFGLDAAQTMLGHSSAKMTEHYAEVDQRAGAEVARAIG